MQQYDARIHQVTDVLRRLTDREIALLVLNIRKDSLAYPPAAEVTRLILELSRKELLRRHSR